MASEIIRDTSTLAYSLQCLRCGCSGVIAKNLELETACPCICCHYKDATCVYTSVDRCIDCGGRYSIHPGKTVWSPPYFSCPNHCLRTKKSALSDNFSTVNQNHVDNVRNTLSTGAQKTLLHSAVLAGDPELTWDLLCRGANPFVKDRMGVTPIDLARVLAKGSNEVASNEKKVYNILPKQSFPDVSVELPEDVSKVRTHSDYGPETANYFDLSPHSPKWKKYTTLRQTPPERHSKLMSSSIFSASPESLPPPPIDQNDSMAWQDLPSSGHTTRRRRSRTLTLSSDAYPPSPPRVRVVDHMSKPLSPGRRKKKERAMSLTNAFQVDLDHAAPSNIPTEDTSYGFARRKRGSSLTDSATLTSESRSILNGIVNAGIRHAKANAPNLSRGTQKFSHLTLLHMSGGNECSIADLHMPIVEEEEDDVENDKEPQVRHTAGKLAKAPVEGSRWELLHLKNTIVSEVEIERPQVPPSDPPEETKADNSSSEFEAVQEEEDPYKAFAMALHKKSPPPLKTTELEDTYDCNDIMVTCTGCMDLLHLSQMKYSCERLGCLSHLCQECLFRLVFVTITSALYAVPSIRCPGRCMCPIPTRLWRGGLKNLKVEDDDKEAMRLNTASMMHLLDALYESFEVFCLDYESGVVDSEARLKHTRTLLSRVEDVVKADEYTIEDVYSVITSDTSRDRHDSESTELEDSNKSISNFASFSSTIHPGKSITDDEIGSSFMRMEDILNSSEVESVRLDIKKLRLKNMHVFVAEVAAIVRDRLDVTLLYPQCEEDAKEDAESLLMRRYMSNAQALLTIRCNGCDETTSLWHCIENGKKVTTDSAERERQLTKLLDNMKHESAALEFLRVYTKFMSGSVPPGVFVSGMFEAFLQSKKCLDEEDEEERNDEIRKSAKNGVLKQEAMKHMNKILSLIVDCERRFAAQLEVLRKYPKIKVPCCDEKHCFLCKVGGHHKGKSCAEVQMAEMGTECQYCPGCGVATLRTEGCKEVLCVCGAVWKWDAKDEESSIEGDWEDSDSDSDSDSDGDY